MLRADRVVRSENGQTRDPGGDTHGPVALDPDACHRALRARDLRFDGVFYVGVRTTGIYCRPICPVRTPGRERCVFFGSAAQAERAGFRACLRCRPELAPGLARIDAIPRLIQRATARIEAGFLDEHSVEDLARSLGVTSRHLRRSMEQALGVSPVELAQTQRLALAKQLLHDTRLPIATVAHAAGFGSVRRFNAVFRGRFDRPPSSLRRASSRDDPQGLVEVHLGVRAPWDGRALLGFLAARAIPGVERVEGDEYRRTVELGTHTGWLSARVDPERRATKIRLTLGLIPRLAEVVARLRALLDLDARPDLIDEHLRAEPALRRSVIAHPGLRVPGAFDGFEVAIRAILGQQVTVRGATTLSGRLVERFGEPLPEAPEGLSHRFPRAEALAATAAEQLAGIGLPGRRAQTIVTLSRAVVEGRVDLSASADPRATIAALCELPGIGPWTAHYIAMRALKWPDAFPVGDLGIQKALRAATPRAAEARAASWSPWRAYGVMHLWTDEAQGAR